MLDLNDVPESVILARGKYATVRAAHEDAKKRLASLCGELTTVSSRILRTMQPDDDKEPDGISTLLTDAEVLIIDIKQCAESIDSLARQRWALRKDAW